MKCWIKGNKITMIRAIIFMLIRWSGTPTSPESSSVQTMVYMSFRLTVWYRYEIIKHWGWINGDAEKRHCGVFFPLYFTTSEREREIEHTLKDTYFRITRVLLLNCTPMLCCVSSAPLRHFTSETNLFYFTNAGSSLVLYF